MTRKQLIEYGEKLLMLTDGKMQCYIAATLDAITWHPVKEELPAADTFVMVTVERDGVRYVTHAYVNTGREFGIPGVIAWMYDPEPYEED